MTTSERFEGCEKLAPVMGCECFRYETEPFRTYWLVGPRGGIKEIRFNKKAGQILAAMTNQFGCVASLKGNGMWTDKGGELRPYYAGMVL